MPGVVKENRKMNRLALPLSAVVLLGAPGHLPGQTIEELTSAVHAAETAFAQTMADRDLEAFESFLAREAIFLTGGELRGAEKIAAGWSPFFDGAEAPFSWEPEQVVVLESGALALSSGPVFDPEGTRIGTFNSVWRLESDGRWRVVFDKGCPPCE